MRHLPRLFQERALFPLTTLLIVLFYGYIVGSLRMGLAPATYDLLVWIAPMVFGLLALWHWRDYPVFRAVTQKVFFWGLALLSLYGILQFFSLPAWDVFFVLSAPNMGIGVPRPFQLRVFSLLNSQLPFAAVTAAGLLFLMAKRHWMAIPVALIGYTALLLSLVRTVWLTLIIGLLVFLVYPPLRTVGRSLQIAAGALIAVLFLALPASQFVDLESAAYVVGDRFNTFTYISEDASLYARLESTYQVLASISRDPIGKGLGASGTATFLVDDSSRLLTFDNGLLDIPYTFGWLGGAAFIVALGAVLLRVLRPIRSSDDLLVTAARAVAVSSSALILSVTHTFTGVVGALFWSSTCLVFAAQHWHRNGDLTVQLYDSSEP
jgi:hypothetical protein